MSRGEHLAWAKERALVYLDMGRYADAFTSLASDFDKHPELGHYELHRRCDARRRREARPARLRANRLLRQFLTPMQRRQLQQRRCFDVLAPSGTRYRFWPRTHDVAELELHDGRWYEIAKFCLHPEDSDDLPATDVSIAQLLLLSADEEEFLRRANRTEPANLIWAGEWRRRLNRVRAMRR